MIGPGADVINLRLARKARDRRKAESEADANRARYGQTLGERARHEQETRRAERTLDGARRGDDSE